jgi:hypothetical protein
VIKLISSQPKWLAGLIILVAATLVIGGCTPVDQPPDEQPPIDEPPVNNPPVIDSLTAEPQEVGRAETSAIECVASDPDGDELSYTWLWERGDIEGEGPIVTWVAPNAYDTYTITVIVTDGRGEEATQSIDIEVTCGCH